MRTRRSLTFVVVAATVLAATACSSDDDGGSSSKATTTKAPITTTVPGSVDSAPTTTLPADPKEFAAKLSSMKADLAAAGSDYCKIALSVSSAADIGQPSSSAELRDLWQFYGDVFTRLAANLPASAQAGDADALRSAAARMLADAGAAGFDPSKISVAAVPPAFSDPAVQAVLSRLSDVLDKNCENNGGEGPTKESLPEEPQVADDGNG